MKKHFRMISTALALMLVLSCTVHPAFSADRPEDESTIPMYTQESTTPSYSTYSAEDFHDIQLQDFTEYISCFFNDYGTWRAINPAGNDISQAFYEENIQNYLDQDYEAVMANADGVIAYLDCVVDIVDIDDFSIVSTEVYASQSRSCWDIFSCIPNLGGSMTEVAVDLTGTFTYNTSTGKITSTDTPSLVVEEYLYPDNGIIYASNVKRIHGVISDGSQATFGATFNLYCEYTMGQFDDYGKFDLGFVSDTNGGRPISKYPGDYVRPS